MKAWMLLATLLISFGSFAESQELSPLGEYKRTSDRRTKYNDVWGYEKDGREYALLGVTNGISVIDVTDPANLREIEFFRGSYSTWRDIKTFGHYAYVVNESSGGMKILDLSELPNRVTLASTYQGFLTAHNIFIDKGRKLLFAEGTHSKPVRILSLENPTAPVEIASLGVECHDIFAQDGLLYVSEGGHGTIGIFSYEDPRNPTLVSRFEIPNAGYVHNAWATENGRYLMTTEENTGKTLKLWDLSDLQNVRMVDEIIGPSRLAHNTHIKGNFAYVSHYGSGLRIYDISKKEEMQEVAFWQNGATQGGFVSAWGAYPFFKSGKILISDIKDGLFIVEHASARE